MTRLFYITRCQARCDIMEAIRKMEPAWEKVNGLKFQLVEYRDAKGELRPCYQLTKTECLYIATKFNDEASHGARHAVTWRVLQHVHLYKNHLPSRLRSPLGFKPHHMSHGARHAVT